jgi:hypothetical protein
MVASNKGVLFVGTLPISRLRVSPQREAVSTSSSAMRGAGGRIAEISGVSA